MEIKWKTLEYEDVEKNSDWFWALWIISIGVIVLSIIYSNVLFAILVFVASFTISIQAVKKPKIINCKIDDKGISVYKRKHLFNDLESYWIKEDNNFPRIILKSKKTFIPYIIIPLGDFDTQIIDDCLIDILEKKEHNEPLPYEITKYF